MTATRPHATRGHARGPSGKESAKEDNEEEEHGKDLHDEGTVARMSIHVPEQLVAPSVHVDERVLHIVVDNVEVLALRRGEPSRSKPAAGGRERSLMRCAGSL